MGRSRLEAPNHSHSADWQRTVFRLQRISVAAAPCDEHSVDYSLHSCACRYAWECAVTLLQHTQEHALCQVGALINTLEREPLRSVRFGWPTHSDARPLSECYCRKYLLPIALWQCLWLPIVYAAATGTATVEVGLPCDCATVYD